MTIKIPFVFELDWDPDDVDAGHSPEQLALWAIESDYKEIAYLLADQLQAHCSRALK